VSFWRKVATPITAPIKAAKDTAELLELRRRGVDALDTAKEAAAAPALYRDPPWQRRMLQAVVRLVAVLPLPQEIRDMTFLTHALANYKTTLVGLSLMLGGCIALANGVPITDEKAGGAILAGLGFMLAKDANVTGGSTPQTEEAAERVITAKPEA
jgi:hypothetical protein